MISKLGTAANLYNHLGSSWMAYRLMYAIQQKLGVMQKRFPASTWDSQPLTNFLTQSLLADPHAYIDYKREYKTPFFFESEQAVASRALLKQWDSAGSSPIADVEQLKEGRLRYFSGVWAELGLPLDWFTNPFIKVSVPHSLHWSKIPDFGYGDIKVIWEPSRFGFVYTLVRAYYRTGDESYAELFWSLVEEWRVHNPPQHGPNWKCGQETSFRVMAWCFGLYGFLQAPVSWPQRVADLAQMIAVSGHRIEGNLDYALSQRNNHGISEGVGLWTIGLLFPELSDAERWRKKGQQVLERLAQDLIYDDGAFAQNSNNYHRVMLHDYIWAIRLGELHGCPLSNRLRERVNRAANFLYQLQDSVSGAVPLYGHNDGALILPLSNCGFADFRPVINAALYLESQERIYDSGPWDEDLFWLYGKDAVNQPVIKPKPSNFVAEPSGYYTIRSPKGFLFTRCGQYKDRPAHADALHVDIWWRGQNIVCDAGTYSYNAPKPWDYQLARSVYHNTVTVDGYDQMEKHSKFLWLPWLSGTKTTLQSNECHGFEYWEGGHNGYLRLAHPINHRRGIIRLPKDHWLIVDRLNSTEAHHYRLHWLLTDALYRLDEAAKTVILETEMGCYFAKVQSSVDSAEAKIVRASPDSPEGWRAPCYQTREPALAWQLTAEATSIWFWTLFGPEDSSLNITDSRVEIYGELWQADLMMQSSDKFNAECSLITDLQINRGISSPQ